MSSFFNSDNSIFNGISKIFDLLMLSLVWLVLCIPVVTIGPASTALYYTVVKVIRRERSYVFKEFFRSFKLNFKQGAIVGLIYVVLGVIMFFDIEYAKAMAEEGSKMGNFLYIVFVVMGFFTLFTILYIFPLLSRFTVTIKHLFKWAFYISLRQILWTLVLTLIFAATVALMFFSFYLAPPLFVFLPGLYTLIASFPMEKVLKKYMPKEENTDEEDGVDRWYNE